MHLLVHGRPSVVWLRLATAASLLARVGAEMERIAAALERGERLVEVV